MFEVPWLEWGLAGLFGVFALVLTRFFLSFLDRQMDRWGKRLGDIDSTLTDLNTTIQKLNGG